MEEISIICPYCAQRISIVLDKGTWERTDIIEECDVCCRPIEINYEVKDNEVSIYSVNTIEGNEI
ncbi:MAG: CPXCG motif-containing cysteine-rich protein [Campylobacterales bacterium]|nr:CPXCG motif-containing cysteine-rich protein [Campylobacterales bacterium]NQY54389.1 CPXCG motif-containing cysteine-rich protein [Campylobacteraceae bacterium]